MPGLVWAPGGRVRAVFDMLVRDGQIVVVEMLADPAALGERQVELR